MKSKRPRKKSPPKSTRAIHQTIAARRAELGLTQEQLASTLGVDKTAISHWEAGASAPRATSLPAVAEALDLPIERLLRDLLEAA